MISKEELRIKQAEFEGERQEYKKELKKLEEKRKKFVNTFSKERIKNIKLEEYALQKGKKESKNWEDKEFELEDKGDKLILKPVKKK